jgi:hypothetical protein
VVARAAVRTRGLGASAVLGIYVVLLTLVPAHLVVPALGGTGTPANVFALLALLWYLASWLSGRMRVAPGTRAPRIAMCALAVAVLLAYIADAQRGSSTLEVQAADRGLIQLTAWISIVVIATAGIRSYRELDRLMRRLVVCASVVAGIGVVEFFTRKDFISGISLPGLSSNVTPIDLMDRGAFTRPTSTTIQPLEFGALMVMLLPFALQQAFDPRRTGRIRKWLPVVLIAAAAPMSISRTSVIGIIVVLVLLFPTWPATRRWPAVGVLFLALGATKAVIPGLIGTLTGLFSAMFSGGDSSTQARTGDYNDVFTFFAQRPWSGRGFGTFLPALYRYTDDFFLLALVEMGIIGVLATLIVFITMIHCGGAGRRRFVDPSRREMGQSIVAAGAVALVSSATFDTLTFPIFSGCFFLLLGCAGAYLGLARQEVALDRARTGPAPGTMATRPADRRVEADLS